jgi:hypothetical protein
MARRGERRRGVEEFMEEGSRHLIPRLAAFNFFKDTIHDMNSITYKLLDV